MVSTLRKCLVWWLLVCTLLFSCRAMPGERTHNRGIFQKMPFHLCEALAQDEKITLQGVLRHGDFLYLVANGYTHEIHLVGQRSDTLRLRHSLFMLNDETTKRVFQPRAGAPAQRKPDDYDTGDTTETSEPEDPPPKPTPEAEPHPPETTLELRPEPTSAPKPRPTCNPGCKPEPPPPPCGPTCSPCQDPDNLCGQGSYVSVVPWYIHPWTKSGNPAWDTDAVELWRLNMAHYTGNNNTWKHYLFKGGHTMIYNMNDWKNCKETDNEYRYFSVAGDGLKGGLTFCYTEYIPFNQESLTEDVDVIINRRRVVVTPLNNPKTPFIIPKTVNDRLMEKNKYHTMTTTEERASVLYDSFDPQTILESENNMDLLKTVPFGFIFSGKVYVFSIATKEVIVFDYSKTISNGGKSPVIIKTWNDFFLCKSVQRRSLTARDSSGKLSQAEYAARVDEYNKEEELGNRIFEGMVVGILVSTLIVMTILLLLIVTLKKRFLGFSRISRGSKRNKRSSTRRNTTTSSGRTSGNTKRTKNRTKKTKYTDKKTAKKPQLNSKNPLGRFGPM